MNDDEIRWPLGEAVMENSGFVPGAFVFVYAAVLGWKWAARAVGRATGPKPPLLPPPTKLLPPPRPEERMTLV